MVIFFSVLSIVIILDSYGGTEMWKGDFRLLALRNPAADLQKTWNLKLFSGKFPVQDFISITQRKWSGQIANLPQYASFHVRLFFSSTTGRPGTCIADKDSTEDMFFLTVRLFYIEGLWSIFQTGIYALATTPPLRHSIVTIPHNAKLLFDRFLPRDVMRKRGLCCRPVSVRLPVCLLRWWYIVSTPLKISSNFFLVPVAPSF